MSSTYNLYPNDHKLMDNQTIRIESIIMSTLSTLTTSQLSTLTSTLSSTFHNHHHRLASLLSSPTLFTHTLNHLQSLSLPEKSLLISRHLLSFLHLLAPFFPLSLFPTFPAHSHRFRLRDLDAVLLLLYFCEIRHIHPKSLETSPVYWHEILVAYCCDIMLKITACTVTNFEILSTFIDILVKCKRFVSTKGWSGQMARREIATSAAAVVAFSSVEVKKGGGCVECTICMKKFREGRDVCELPCQHLFHWMCVLPWLSRSNTCPCCRFRLPTDDVYGETHRLWDVIMKLGMQVLDSEHLK